MGFYLGEREVARRRLGSVEDVQAMVAGLAHPGRLVLMASRSADGAVTALLEFRPDPAVRSVPVPRALALRVWHYPAIVAGPMRADLAGWARQLLGTVAGVPLLDADAAAVDAFLAGLTGGPDDWSSGGPSPAGDSR